LFETRNVFLQCKALGPEIREGRKTRETIDTDDGEFKMPRKYVGHAKILSTAERQAGREGCRQRQRDALHLSVSSSRS
jgi:hypothetical protein